MPGIPFLRRKPRHVAHTRLGKLITAARSGLKRYPREIAASLVDAHPACAQASNVYSTRGGEALRRALGADHGAYWLGHATVLLRIGGVTVLTDPVFSDRIGPRLGSRTVGISRLAPLPVTPGALPRPDLILLSHAHFDHLDRPTLASLAHPSTTIVAARATGGLVPRGYGRVIELDWGQTCDVRGVRITALPTAHWGARTALDRRRGHNAYVLERDGRRMLFGGDTAHTDAFDRVGRVDLAALGIGAYESWDHAHATPEQAWDMARRMRCARLLPMHHATFNLGEAHAAEPLERLLRAARGSTDRLVCARIGDAWTLAG